MKALVEDLQQLKPATLKQLIKRVAYSASRLNGVRDNLAKFDTRRKTKKEIVAEIIALRSTAENELRYADLDFFYVLEVLEGALFEVEQGMIEEGD